MMSKPSTSEARIKRHRRVRQKVVGTAAKPRLSVFRSLNHIYAQVIDDSEGHTLVCASSLDAEIRGDSQGKSKSGRAELVGTLLARRANEKGIRQVSFDRGGFRYHGRVKALAEAARKGGLEF
jgi:large subunit ribosomal protein L18